MFSLGGSEILVLGVLALLLFGNKNLPQNMKKMVKGLNEVKKVANDAQRSWHEIRDDVTRQIMADEAAEKARNELSEIHKALAATGEPDGPGEAESPVLVPPTLGPPPLTVEASPQTPWHVEIEPEPTPSESKPSASSTDPHS